MRASIASAALVTVSLAIGLLLARTTGATYDEPPYLGFSWAYLHGGPKAAVREYPPVPSYLRGAALAAAGAGAPNPPAGLVTGAVEPHVFGQLFLFYNRVPPEALLFWGRAAGLLFFALLLGVLRWWGGLFALAFAAFDPNLLAHSSLATTDGAFIALFIAALALWEVSPVAAGAVGGLALGSKATAIILPLIFLYAGRARPKAVAYSCAAFAAVALLCYVPTGAGGFFDMLMFRTAQMGSPAPTYLFGTIYPQGHPLYFPAILLIKTTLPLLFLGAWGLADARLWKGREERRRLILAAGAVILLSAMSARRQLGVRYVLALYPLLALGAGAAAAALWSRGGRARLAAGALLSWHAASSLAALPQPLAYANEAFGGPAAAWRLMGDSNVDWGQALPELRDFIEENPGGLILSYFGRDCPSRHGLEAQAAFSTPGPCPRGAALALDVEREWLAVSATKRQGFYESGPPAWAWLESRAPAAVAGRAILIYDVSRDADAHERLAAMYAA
ncbi:MAG: hypothetical protein NUW21_06795, partial [Elusimicrobia bacterium]|nr:hypothetical protein [Elusimicrobiota bacterium]